MKFTEKSDTSFLIESEGGEGQVYQMPEKYSNWQMSEMTGLIGAVLADCEEAGNVIATTIINVLNETKKGESGKQKKIDAVRVLAEVQKVIGGQFITGAIRGTSQLLKAIKTHKLMATATAVMFLKPGEADIDESSFSERIRIMNGVPMEFAFGALKHFFTTKAKSLSDSNSPSETTATTKK